MGFWARLTKPKAQLSLLKEKNEFVLGEEAKGTVQVQSKEVFDIKGITVGLFCEEFVKKTRIVSESSRSRYNRSSPEKEEFYEEEYWDSEILDKNVLMACNERTIPVGLSEFPFAFQLSSVGRETYHSVDRKLQWILWAEMKVKGRRSIRERNKVVVAKPSVTQKVVREVVLIPCEYCKGLMPQVSIFCPNCGARRK